MCDCQLILPENSRKYTYCLGESLKSGNTKSCGCYKKDKVKQAAEKRRKINKYDLSGEYGIGWDKKNNKFIFDLEDYDLLKEFSWHFNGGYFSATTNQQNCGLLKTDTRRNIYMHKLVLGISDTSILVDHINGFTWDNRKQNLRIVDKHENKINCKISSNNTSGHKGVYFNKHYEKWMAYITYNYKTIYLGCFDDYKEAIIAREEAEQKYFGEYNRAQEFIHNGSQPLK